MSLDLDPSTYIDDLAGFDIPDAVKTEFLLMVMSIMRTFVENGWDVKQVGALLGIEEAPNAEEEKRE